METDVYPVVRQLTTRPTYPPRRQDGAVLYVALIMLVLLALIGIIGMQVAGMQERMSANYLSVNLAFQNAEGEARNAECVLEDIVNRTVTAGCDPTPVGPVNLVCDDGFDVGDWVSNQSLGTGLAVNARLIGPCISGNTPLDMGAPVSEDPNPIYQVTSYNTDRETNASAAAAIDTIFRP